MSGREKEHRILVGNVGRGERNIVAVVKHVEIPTDTQTSVKHQKVISVKLAKHPKEKGKIHVSMEISYGDSAENVWNWASSITPQYEINLNGKKYVLRGDWHPRTHIEMTVNRALFEAPSDEKILEVLRKEKSGVNIAERLQIRYIGFGPHYSLGDKSGFQKAVPRIVEIQHEGRRPEDGSFAGLMAGIIRNPWNSRREKQDKKIPGTFPELGTVQNITKVVEDAIMRSPQNVDLGPLNYIVNARRELRDKKIAWKDRKNAENKVRKFLRALIENPERLRAFKQILTGEYRKRRAAWTGYGFLAIEYFLKGAIDDAAKNFELARRVESENDPKIILRTILGSKDADVRAAAHAMERRAHEPIYPSEVREFDVHEIQSWNAIDRAKRKFKVLYDGKKLIMLPSRKGDAIHGSPAIVLDLKEYNIYIGTYDKRKKKIVGATPLNKLIGHLNPAMKHIYEHKHEYTNALSKLLEKYTETYLDIYGDQIATLAEKSGKQVPKNYRELALLAASDARIHTSSPANMVGSILSTIVDAHDALLIKRARENGDTDTLIDTVTKSEFSHAIGQIRIRNIGPIEHVLDEYLSKMYENAPSIGTVNAPEELIEKIRALEATDKKLRKDFENAVIAAIKEKLQKYGIATNDNQIKQKLHQIATKFPENMLRVLAYAPPTVRGKLIALGQIGGSRHETASIGAFNYHRDLVRSLARIAIHDGNLAEDLSRLLEEYGGEAEHVIHIKPI